MESISFQMVADEDDFRTVLDAFLDWMRAESLAGDASRFAFVTCGDWDLKTMLPAQCADVDVPVPDCFSRWINAKTAFSRCLPQQGRRSLAGMLAGLDLQFVGRPHSGIDDSENIARVMRALALRGCVFEVTGSTR